MENVTRLAIIGTAGRRGEHRSMPGPVWTAMHDHATRVVDRVLTADGVARDDLVLVSGGAPYADHLAVRLFLDGSVGGLELHLPRRFEDGAFVPERVDDDRDPAAILHHHQRRMIPVTTTTPPPASPTAAPRTPGAAPGAPA